MFRQKSDQTSDPPLQTSGLNLGQRALCVRAKWEDSDTVLHDAVIQVCRPARQMVLQWTGESCRDIVTLRFTKERTADALNYVASRLNTKTKRD